jgi:hypothetical protein
MYHRPSQLYQVPSAMRLPELTKSCSSLMNNSSRSVTNIEQYWLELFYRALVQHDPDAWELLQERCYPLVRTWMAKYPHHAIACSYKPVAYYAAHTFTRVWQSSMDNNLEFDTLSAAIGYLKFSLQGVVIDALRVFSRPYEAPPPDSGSGQITNYIEEPAAENNYGSSEVWDNIESLLSNERERRLAYLFYHCNLKPKEIVRDYPEEFSDVQEIYPLTRNIMQRLIHNRDQCRRQL